jgi:type I site-specific restriction-modification system R (restriction) subunit
MYQVSTLHILHEGALSKPIVANSGVKQGCVLSRTIFIIVMDYIMKMVTANKRRGITWKLTERLEDLNYADDICLHSQSYKNMIEKLEDLNKEAVKVGLKDEC